MIGGTSSDGTTISHCADQSSPRIEFYVLDQIYSESGVDLSLLRQRLAMSVTQRWEQNARALELVEAFREAGRAQRARTAAAAEGS